MKKLLLNIFLLTIALSLFATDYSTTGTGGVWNNAATWDDGSTYPDEASDNALLNNGDSVWLPNGVTITVGVIEFGNRSKLYIPANSTLIVESISVLNRADFYIDGTLTINGDINMENNSALDISLTGSLDIGGDFFGNNNVSITNDGDISIDGDLYLGNGATLEGDGTVTAETYSGTGTVFGTSIGDLTGGTTYEDGGGSAAPLPIELTYFKAYHSNNNVTINWQTATEENNDYFNIERSVNGVDYEIIGTVLGAGNSMTSLNYSFIDNNPVNGVSYYRLKQTDYDGAFEVFSPVSVSYLNEADFKFGPNPAINEFNIMMNGTMGTGTIQLYSITGALIKNIELTSNYTTIDVSNLPAGNYMMVISANENQIKRKVMIQ